MIVDDERCERLADEEARADARELRRPGIGLEHDAVTVRHEVAFGGLVEELAVALPLSSEGLADAPELLDLRLELLFGDGQLFVVVHEAAKTLDHLFAAERVHDTARRLLRRPAHFGMTSWKRRSMTPSAPSPRRGREVTLLHSIDFPRRFVQFMVSLSWISPARHASTGRRTSTGGRRRGSRSVCLRPRRPASPTSPP